MSLKDPSSGQHPSSKFAELLSRHSLTFLIVAVAGIWLWQSFIPQQLFATEDERVQFLTSVGAPPSTRIITLVTEWCPACKSLDHELTERKIPHVRLDVEKDSAGGELFQRVYAITSSNSIPKIILDKDIVSRPQLFLELAKGEK